MGIVLHQFTRDWPLTSNTHTTSSFKGDDTTFGDFPSRLQHILLESAQGMVIESIVFPAYEVRFVSSIFFRI